MEAEREDDPGTAVHPPEESADAVFGSHLKAVIPEKHLPVQCLPFIPEWGAEDAPMRIVARGHESLQVVSRIQLVKHDSAGKMRVVSAQAHHLFLFRHVRRWI